MERLDQDYHVSNQIAPKVIGAIDNSIDYFILDKKTTNSKQIVLHTFEDPKEGVNLDLNISNCDKIIPDSINTNKIERTTNNSILDHQVQIAKEDQTVIEENKVSTRQNQAKKGSFKNAHFSYFNLLPTVPLPITDIPHCKLCNNAIFVHEADLAFHHNSYHHTMT